MKLLRFATAFAVCAGTVAAQDLNRIQLDNGTDVLFFINAPFAGADIGTADVDQTGDSYHKVFPAAALRRCSGSANLQGIEAVMYDTDFFSSEVLWDYTITTATSTLTAGTIVPGFTDGVFVAGVSTTGTIFGSAGCAAPGYLSGWIYDETFVDSLGNPTPLISITADGTADWVFTHFFPNPGISDHDAYGPPNSCGSSGDFTLQWGASSDGIGIPGTDGENQPDVLSTGATQYLGVNVGGGGVYAPVAQAIHRGAELALYFEGPTAQIRVDTDNGDGFPGPELGVAALETPLQINSSLITSSGTTTFGPRVYDAAAATTGTDVTLWVGGAPPTFLDTFGSCLAAAGGQFALLPDSTVTAATGLNAYTNDGTDTFNDSNLIPAGTGGGWQNFPVAWQAHRVSLISGSIVSSSNQFTHTFRFNDGL